MPDMSKENNNSRSSRSKKKKPHVLRLAIISIATVILFGIGIIYVVTAGLSKNSVPIVSAPPTPVVSSTPIPTPDLLTITGEPEDIGDDVDEPAPVETEEPIYQQVPIDGDAINILVVGQDIRPNQNGRGRSDTMMLLSYNRKTGKASIVSLMRDNWVPIQGHDWNRLNATYSFGGIGLTINTINSLFSLDIQNYVIIDFESMVQLVDEIDGVDVEFTEIEAKYYNKTFNWNVSAGVQHLDGDMALKHARNRKSNGGDFERIRRQQDIMLAIFDKLKQKRNPVVFAKLLSIMLPNIGTNMQANQIFSMALEILSNGNLDIQRGRVPADKTWRYANKEGRSVIAIDMDENKKYIHDMIYK